MGFWAAFVCEAELQREQVSRLITWKALDTNLPDRGSQLLLADPVVDVSGPKSLRGFLLSCQDRAN